MIEAYLVRMYIFPYRHFLCHNIVSFFKIISKYYRSSNFHKEQANISKLFEYYYYNFVRRTIHQVNSLCLSGNILPYMFLM